MKILIAEDDATSRWLLERVCRRWGHETQSVETGTEALEQLEKLEQLRLIEAGIRIDTLEVDGDQCSVDTPEQLEQARAMAAGRSW